MRGKRGGKWELILEKKRSRHRCRRHLANVPPAEDDTVFEEYDIAADREQMSLQLVNSPEVDALASQIEVYNPETIVSFGSEAADEISKASDVVLNSMNMSQLDDSSEMLKALTKIMSNFGHR